MFEDIKMADYIFVIEPIQTNACVLSDLKPLISVWS